MPPIINGNWDAPFWGATKTFITGQDMLGMQNTSIATYATLLPGLTNLTRRMRYYGFYVWMLEQYAKRKGKVSVAEFQKFMRRGELLLAFVMSYKYPDEVGVVGSQYAKDYLDSNINIIDLAAGADRDSQEKVYWKYSSGAFGQYYQGALTAMGLIAPSEKDNRIHISTPNYGRKLAAYFENMIVEQKRNLYLEIIDKGRVTLNDLDDLSTGFSLTGIEPDSDEWQFYISMLFDNDSPTSNLSSGHTSFRRETILLYLEYRNNKKKFKDSESFPRSFYYRLWDKKPFVDFTTTKGWYYYALNEFAHYSLETIFWALLVELNIRGAVYFSDIVNDFSHNSFLALKKEDDKLDITDNMSFKSFADRQYLQEFTPGVLTDEIHQTRENEHFNGVKNAILVLALIYSHDKKQITNLHAYSRMNNMYRSDDVVDLLAWIKKNEDLVLISFIKKLLKRHIINRHIEVAMRKMRNRNENTLKFLFEDNLLKPIAIVEPLWTGPRLDSMHRFLVDLKLVNEKDELTQLGSRILKDKLQ